MSKFTLFAIFLSFLSFQNFAQTSDINFKIIEEGTGNTMPAKIVLMQNSEPFFHKLKSTNELACRDNTIYSATGEGSFQIPAGEYEIWFGKGMEYSIETQQHFFESGKIYDIQAVLRKEINTDGFVAGDMHLHTFTFSGHGDATVEERLISCVAEGLEWAVSTDHNYVLDYAPYMDSLGLKKHMATTVGNEVSTNIGHFNTYPLYSDNKKANSKITDGSELFNHIRENAPEEVIIQVNHPRWIDSDYFNTKGLDPHFGSSKHPEWSWDFDAIEVLNETTQLGWIPAPDNKFSVFKDWIHFQNQNQRITAIGNSDTHSVTEMIAGVPRNYIASSTDIPSEISELEISNNIKNQMVSVSSGIFVNMTADGKGIGETVNSNGKTIAFHLTAQAASWISCDRVEFLQNGLVVGAFDIPETTNSMRLDTVIRIRPERDSWYMIIAYGDTPTPPILQIKKKPILPKGFTNPIWVNVSDNDGEFESVYDFSLKKAETEPFVAFKKYPETIPYIFKHLFEIKHEKVGILAESFLKNPGTSVEHKLMIYRELSKIGTPQSDSILLRQKEKYLTPLEEVSLEWFLNFPLSKSRFDNFKEKQKDALSEQLSYLEREFLYVHSGAVKRDFLIWKDEAETWENVYLSNNGVLKFDESKGEVRNGNVLLKKSFFALKDTVLTGYLRTNSERSFILNGGTEIGRFFNNLKENIESKIVEIPLRKGWNEIQFRLKFLPKTEFTFLPFKNELILTDAEEIKFVGHSALNKPVKYLTEYSPKYHGFGAALTDGLRGTKDHGNQLWQGWNAENMEVVIDLEKEMTVRGVRIGLLSNHNSWIFLPTETEVFVSNDGKNFEKTSSRELPNATESEPTEIMDLVLSFDSKKQTRFIKIVAHKLPKIPDWHVGAGGDGSWIFADEVMVY